MWNYSFVVPELFINATFLFFYLSQKKLPLRVNKAFIFILLIDISTIVIDLCATWSLEYFNTLPNFVLRLQNVIFFLLFLQRVICFFLFTVLVLHKDMRKTIFLRTINLLPFLAICIIVILNLFTDIIFCISKEGVYSAGRYYFLIYFCAFYYLADSFILLFSSKKTISRSEFYPCLAFNLVLVFGYIMRIIHPRYLIMNFFTLIAIIIIFLAIENPNSYIEEKSGAFNKKGLKAILREIKQDHFPMILGFTIHNYNDLRDIYSNTQTDKGLSLIAKYLKQTFPKTLVFYIHDGRFVLIGKNLNEAKSIRKIISERFDSPWNTGKDIDMFFEVSFAYMDPQIINYNKNLLFPILHTTLNEINSQKQAFITIGFDTINKLEQNTQIKRAVETAVDQNSIELFLQPLVDVINQKLVGAESLARIKDSEGNYIPPNQFIPIAEKNGRINALGEQMFEKTCQFIKENDIEKMGLSWINVNLSPIQFLRSDLNKRFTTILNKYDISPEMIHLEITEESMIDFDLLQTQMQNMKASGFRFVLDDYGRGYSNVARMKKCPFENVKLDMEFVWDYFKYKDKILPTLVQTIKQMNFTVTAEGIENLEMAHAMKEIGCDYLQGFYYSKPLSAKEFAEKYSSK